LNWWRNPSPEDVVTDEAQLTPDLRTLASQFGIGSWHWDITSSTLHWSPELFRLYGMAEQFELPMTLERFLGAVHKDDCSNVRAVVSETLSAHRERHEQRFRIVRPNGEVRFVLSRAQLQRGLDGKPTNLAGIDIDLGSELIWPAGSAAPVVGIATNPALAERPAPLDSDLFRNALQAIPSHVVVLDTSGTIFLANAAWDKFASAGGSPDLSALTVGANYLTVCSHAAEAGDVEAAQALAGIRKVLEGSSPHYELVYKCHGPSGEQWFLMTVTPLGGKSAEGAVVLHQNVTAVKQAEDAMRASERRFSATFDNAAIGLAHIAADGRMLNANRRLCDMVGYSRDELMALPTLHEIVRPDDRDIARAQIELIRTGALESCRDEQRFIRADGSILWVIATLGCVRTASGGIDYLVAGFEDVSSQKLVEERQQTLLLELSHRSKNMLGVIQSIVSRSLVGDRSLAEAREALSGRLQALAKTNEILTVAAFDGVLLNVILENELQAFTGRVRLDGPIVKLTDKAAQTLALVVHELATNATKYGALSVAGGAISVTWTVQGDAAAARLSFDWREQGGPPAKPPKRSGFGNTLIRQVAGMEFSCTPETRYDEDGFGYRFEAAMDRLGALVTASAVRGKLKHPTVGALYDSWARQRPPQGLPQLASFDWSRFARSGLLTIANIANDGSVHFAQIGHALTEWYGQLPPDFGQGEMAPADAYRRCAQKGEPCHELMRIDFGDGHPFAFERLLVPFSMVGGPIPTHVAGIVVFEGYFGGSTDAV
jgi:PAS domain S-box-containing protein